MQRIFVLHTSTHEPNESSSAAVTQSVLERLTDLYPKVAIQWVDAAKLNIVPNQSCYANGKTHCGDPKSGPYRCWAHHKSVLDPRKYGQDDMPTIYDGLEWCDTFLFTTSVRWGSHTAVAQNVIERMNTLENRGASLGEPYPMKGKRLGVIVTGLHWKTAAVAKDLMDTLRFWGFAQAGEESTLAWQRVADPYWEHPDSDTPEVKKWLASPKGYYAVDRFTKALIMATKTVV